MATLTGNTVASTYESLIKIQDNTSGFATLKTLSDGLGAAMPIKFSSTVVDFQTATTVNFTGVSVVGLTDNVGVSTLNSLTGALTLLGAQNLTITDNGSNTITLTGYDDTPVTTNTSNIATNTTDIATNAGNISTNTGNISTNTTNIATNVSSISTNAGNIATNTTNIATNVTNISNNAGNISTNSSDIALLDGSINTNTTNIATNTSNIATNTADITALENAGYVDTSGTPANSYVSFFSDADTITGETNLTYNTATNLLDAENLLTRTSSTIRLDFTYADPITFDYSGEIADFGSFPASPTVGRIYYLNSSGFWIGYNNTALASTRGILGICVSTGGKVCLRGFIKNAGYIFTTGAELYGASNASITSTQPSGGDFSRIMGHQVATGKIYFNPSQEYIETT